MPVERIRHPQRLGERLSEPDRNEISFIDMLQGWAPDLARLHASLAGAGADRDWELVVVDVTADDEASEVAASLDRTLHVPLADPLGWAAGRNLGLRLATGRIAVVVDTSVEVTGDVVTPIAGHLDDPGIGLVGPWGLVTDDGYAFTEASGPVHAVEAYLMAMRRSDLSRTGLFDPKFRFYRNADLDMSFRVRSAGLRAVADPALPAVRHEHRTWADTPEAERDELSRRNFAMFRRRWGHRDDLLTPA